MSGPSFITEVRGGKEETGSRVKECERFVRVRNEHAKLMEVVAAFGQKVRLHSSELRLHI